MKIVQRLSYACFNILCILSFCFFSVFGITAKAYTPIDAAIPVSCLEISDGRSHIYEIAIESQDNNSPVPASNALSIAESGAGEFTIEITEPGTYVYRIYEKPGTNTNVIYDDTVYYVTVFVTNTEENDLTYAISATVADKNIKPDKMVFRDILSSDTVVNTTAMTVTTGNQSVTMTTKTTAASVVTTSSDSKTTITNLISSILTGDSMPIGLLLLLMGISAIVGLIMIILEKLKKE